MASSFLFFKPARSLRGARTASCTIAALVIAAGLPAADPTPGAHQVVDMLGDLIRFDNNGRNAAQKLGFEIPEKTLNEYAAYALGLRPRPGIRAVSVTLLPSNQVTAAVTIDFDTVRGWDAELVPPPLRPMLSGDKMVRVNGRFESANGTITFTFQDAVGPTGTPLPNKVATDLLEAIGSRQRESLKAAAPIQLPFGLKRIWTEKQLLCGTT